MKRISLNVFFLAATSFLGSCNSSKSPRGEWERLTAKVDTDPPADAIVGMWHKKYDMGAGMTMWRSILLRPDGTGLIDSAGTGNFSIDRGDHTLRPVSWGYLGNGVWQYSDPTANPSSHSKLRLVDGDKLLFGESRIYFSRVPENATSP